MTGEDSGSRMKPCNVLVAALSIAILVFHLCVSWYWIYQAPVPWVHVPYGDTNTHLTTNTDTSHYNIRKRDPPRPPRARRALPLRRRSERPRSAT